MLRKLSLGLLGLAAMLSLIAGGRYLLTDEFMRYHAVVAGRSWAQVSSKLQTIIIGMLWIVGAGFAAGGLSLAWLLYPMSRGTAWARWAALSIAAVLWLPTLAVTFMLKAQAPSASRRRYPRWSSWRWSWRPYSRTCSLHAHERRGHKRAGRQ